MRRKVRENIFVRGIRILAMKTTNARCHEPECQR
jgi:hypothetical protein